VDPRVPILLFGDGVARGRPLPAGTALDRIAPTLADVLGLRRPHPEVRAGEAVPRMASGPAPRLVVEIAWDGVGTTDLRAEPRAWPFVRSLLHDRSTDGTLEATTGSLPLDPAATLTTIGTGGIPAQHGITGTWVRDDRGGVVRAWGPAAPTSVISTLPDDLVQALDQRPKVALVAPDPSDLGLIGNGWAYANHPYDVKLGSGDPLPAVRGLLADGYGADTVPDVLAVVLGGSIASMDRRTEGIVEAVRSAGERATFAVTATGTSSSSVTAMTAGEVAAQVDRTVGGPDPIVAEEVPGGIFLDQGALARRGLSSNAVVAAMLGMRAPSGDERLFADAFPGFAVSFARYC
jgi:hypothetical protein